MDEKETTENNSPITMWGYFGFQLLFAIPLVGLICSIVFAIAAENRNVKNFARSQFCFIIIVYVLIIMLYSALGSLF